MKSIFIISFLAMAFSVLNLNTFFTKRQLTPYSTRNFEDSVCYNVYRIDSINSYFLIYVSKDSSKFKIVSKKDSGICNVIQVGGCYKLELYSILDVEGIPIIPSNQINELGGWGFDDSTHIEFEFGLKRGLFIAKNIKGLCLDDRQK